MAYIFTDFDAAFGINPITGDVPIKAEVEAIKFAIKNLVLTNHYERPFHSEIGSNVSGSLFENMDMLTEIVLREDIALLLDNYEPRVIVTDILVNAYPEVNALNLTIVFVIKNTREQLSVNVTLERTR